MLGLIPKLSQRVGMLGKLNKYMSRDQFRATCDGIFVSCLLYCLPLFCDIWGLPSMDDTARRSQSFTKEDCRKLQVLQNKVLKMKTKNYEKNAPTNKLLDATGDLSVHQLGAHHTIVTAHRIIVTGQPQYLAEKLKSPSENQVFTTRHAGNIVVNCERTISRSGFIYRAAKLWNLLPKALREEPKKEVFKRNMKEWIKANVPRKPP